VPFGLAALKLDPVDHAVAHEPVVALAVGVLRIGPDADIAPVEFRGDRASDGEIGERHFLAHRSVDAAEERALAIEPLAVEARQARDASGDRPANGLFQYACHDRLLPLVTK